MESRKVLELWLLTRVVSILTIPAHHTFRCVVADKAIYKFCLVQLNALKFKTIKHAFFSVLFTLVGPKKAKNHITY